MWRSGRAHAGPAGRSSSWPGPGAHVQLEVLTGIVGSPVAASLRRRASWPRLLRFRIRVAAVLAAEGDAVIGELVPEVRQVPVPQFDPVAGAQGLLAHGLPVYPAGGPTAQVDVDVLV